MSSDELNSLSITGVLARLAPRRMSPAGVEHVDFDIEHHSRQSIAGGAPRLARCVVRARVSSPMLICQVEACALGDRVAIEGALSWESAKEEPGRLVVLVRRVQLLTRATSDFPG